MKKLLFFVNVGKVVIYLFDDVKFSVGLVNGKCLYVKQEKRYELSFLQ